ncbi:MAG: hypothetical protein RL300_1563, partial [Pseudomonadota bacterium]
MVFLCVVGVKSALILAVAPAGYMQHFARDEAGTFAGQERDRIGDIAGSTHTL